MIAATSIRKYCVQSLQSIPAMKGKDQSEQAKFCGCVGENGAGQLKADPVMSSLPDWRQQAHAKAIAACSQQSQQHAAGKPGKTAVEGPDPVRIAAFAKQQCLQQIMMMSAMDGKSAAEQSAFCGCVGDRRAEYLMEKPEWAKKSHWRQKTYSGAIVTCSE